MAKSSVSCLGIWWGPESVSAFTIRRFLLVCKYFVCTTIVNFQINILYRHKIKNRKKKLSKYIWDETPVLKWYIIRTVPSYSNPSKKRLPCLLENSKILYWIKLWMLRSKQIYFVITNLTTKNARKNNWQPLRDVFEVSLP